MLQNTYTTDDLIERLGLMRKYYGVRLFSENKDADIQSVLQEECEPYTLSALMVWEHRFNEGEIQPLVVYEALDTVQEELSGMPSVTLYVPVRFPPDQVERFGKWFRENVQPNILIALHVDPRTTGGCGFIWNDTFFDFSLHYYIQKQRTQIIEMFNRNTHV